MRRAFTLILIPIVTIALVYALIHFIGVQGFAFAWALNFLLMACALTFTETLKSPLTSPYFNEKEWECKGKIYESFGVNFYRKLLVWTGWEKLNKKSNPIEKNTKALTHLHYRTKHSELGHLIIFIIVLGFNIFVAIEFGIIQSLWLLILNILLNLYPVFLQRYNRPRIERAIHLSRRR
ncbi:glycosyl-4,4'-diaponeurosporenoate acyltransferase CrtO family protein [Dyadobacter psychrophilus]|uniref:Glycosyl-4,4'-diaponeurosporenoate acyltransferase n=1 Tax=Dyadobacter psychrophilus TaxID=651661 RepID=A0A1T5ESV6_9BACT|nr:hypothetical protein [Dyadobacter psychrophilus]SKB87035.1 hypothetical protein SAMN05660293_02737 [Dyadobacter psychrophilus]